MYIRGFFAHTTAMDDWVTHMRRGDFAAAWAINDQQLAARAAAGHPPCWHWPRHLQHVWDGSPVAGRRVLVRCYHGLGDTVQFIRFAKPLRAVVAEVIVWAQPSLCELVATAAGVDRVLPLHDGTPDVAYDVDVEVMELPHLFRTSLGTLPAAVPYLHVAAAARPARPSLSGSGQLNVGVVWQAGDWDDRRSVPVELLAERLGNVPGVAWHFLQRGPALADRPASFGTVSAADDPTATARQMLALDLVLTVDSFPAHLAGALGVPVWTLLHADPDWRWMADRDDSPWYPTMRLFRQDAGRPGDWRPVLDRVAAELRQRCESRPALGTPVLPERPQPRE